MFVFSIWPLSRWPLRSLWRTAALSLVRLLSFFAFFCFSPVSLTVCAACCTAFWTATNMAFVPLSSLCRRRFFSLLSERPRSREGDMHGCFMLLGWSFACRGGEASPRFRSLSLLPRLFRSRECDLSRLGSLCPCEECRDARGGGESCFGRLAGRVGLGGVFLNAMM